MEMIHYLSHLKQNEGLRKVPDSILKKILSNAQVKTFSPKENLFLDEKLDRMYFIVKGVVKGLFDHLDVQFCSCFYKAGDVVSNFNSVVSSAIGQLRVESVSYVTVLYMNRSTFDKLMDDVPAIKHLYIENLFAEICKYEYRVRTLLCYPAKERYLLFMEQFGEYISHISQKDIASYLSIKPETLSRMKKALNQ